MLNIWQALEDYDHRVLSFLNLSGNGGQQTNAANFQIMPATRGNPGEVIIVFGGFYYKAELAVERYLPHVCIQAALRGE